MKSPATYDLEIFQTTEMLNHAAARLMIAVANEAIAANGRFILTLSGGQTPLQLYALLAEPYMQARLPWEDTFVFWGDERCVPLTDERNNAYRASSVLLNKVGIPLSHIHPIPADLSPAKAAESYQQMLRHFFGAALARFDLMLLGLGKNGHTASLFPGTAVTREKTAGVSALFDEEEKIFRITMTAPLINQARHILFLVTGAKKAGILEKVLKAPYQPDAYPAQLIKPVDGRLSWFVDQAAGAAIIA